MQDIPPLPRGRRRSPAAGLAILDAARRLVTAHGYDAVTTRMIADAAGAGKQTLYRRWPSKAALVLEAFATKAYEVVDRAASPDEAAERRVAGFLARTFAALGENGSALRSLMATAQSDPVFRALFRSDFIEPRRRALATVLRGALPEDSDIDVVTILLFGAMWYRLLLDEPLDGALADRLAASVIRGQSGLRDPAGDVYSVDTGAAR